MKIGIVGAGSVGATCAYSIATSGLARELLLVDKLVAKAEGEAMDLRHCAAFIPHTRVDSGPLESCAGMDIVVITAGTKRRPGEARTDLVRRNIAVFGEIARPLARTNPDAVFIVVSNPVDLLTLYALKHAGLPPGRVLGTGTLLDSSRLRHLLARRLAVDPRNVHAHIVGEHGAGSVALWSQASVGGQSLDSFAAAAGVPLDAAVKAELLQRVLSAGERVIRRKGATFYGIAQSVLRIVTAVARDESRVLTVSCDVEGFVGIRDMALSLPALVGRDGVSRVLTPDLDGAEQVAFRAAADRLGLVAREVGIL